MNLDPRTLQILSSMKIENNTTTITETLSRPEYVKVNEVLETLGGTWSKKQKKHVWTVSPNDALKVVLSGTSGTITTTLETKKESKKKYQAFYTPDSLADRMVELAHIQSTDRVLEPSAGNGAIVKAIQRVFPKVFVYCYELSEDSRTELLKLENALLFWERDCLKGVVQKKYDKILMNPPFASHADSQHVKHAYDNFLADKGRIVAIMSCHPFFASHKVDKDFVAWLDEVGATVEDIEAGTFKESGTQIATKLVVIDKSNG